MAHQASEELKTFRLGSNHTRNFGIMAALGVVLFVLGIVLSLIKLPAAEGEHHDGGHHEGAPAKEEHGGDGAHQEHHSAVDGKVTVQYASAAHEASPSGGDGPEEKKSHKANTAHDASPEYDHITASGTWRRALWHEDQAISHPHHKEVTMASKVGVSLLIGVYFWFAVALFGVFFIAVSITANASWYVMFRRVLESYYRYLPIGAILLLAIFFGLGTYVYEWWALPVGEDALIDGKRGFLNVAFILGTGILLVGVWSFIGHMFRTYSLEEELKGGLGFFKKQRVISLLFLPLFGFGFSAFAFLWIMSVDPHWFSTIFAVYCFAGLFVSGFTVTMFITTGLKKEGYLPNFSADHLHDISKFMFAFSVFWAYIWISQYLLIWYANIPEETIYYYNRFQDYKLLFGLNVIINFFFPFIVLMTRDAKRKAESMRSAGRVMLFGRFLDIFLLLVPGALGAEGGFPVMLMAAGAVCVFGAVFLFAVFSGFNGIKMEPRNHPYFEESVHHTTGV